jgi:hypothetical protein
VNHRDVPALVCMVVTQSSSYVTSGVTIGAKFSLWQIHGVLTEADAGCTEALGELKPCSEVNKLSEAVTVTVTGMIS